MKIDPNLYKNTLDKLRHHMVDKPEGKRASLISFISFISGVPVVAVCLYLITYLYPDDEILKSRLKSIIEFYRYTEVAPFEKD